MYGSVECSVLLEEPLADMRVTHMVQMKRWTFQDVLQIGNLRLPFEIGAHNLVAHYCVYFMDDGTLRKWYITAYQNPVHHFKMSTMAWVVIDGSQLGIYQAT